jgi:hypothetical protein
MAAWNKPTLGAACACAQNVVDLANLVAGSGFNAAFAQPALRALEAASTTVPTHVGVVCTLPLLLGVGYALNALKRKSIAEDETDARPATKARYSEQHDDGKPPEAAASTATHLAAPAGPVQTADSDTFTTTQGGHRGSPEGATAAPVAHEELHTNAFAAEISDTTAQEHRAPLTDAAAAHAATAPTAPAAPAAPTVLAVLTVPVTSGVPNAPSAPTTPGASVPLRSPHLGVVPRCYAFRSSRDTRVTRAGTGVMSSTRLDRLEQGDIVVVYSKKIHQRVMWVARVAQGGTAGCRDLQNVVEAPAEPCFSYVNLKAATGAEKLHDGRAVQDQRMVRKILALWDR